MVRLRVALPAAVLALAASANAMTYKGCFSSSQPLVSQGTWDYQSSGHCGPICNGLGSGVMGFSGGTECWCGDQLPSANSKVDDSKCNVNCTGYPSEMCGGAGFYTVYATGLKSSVTNYGADPSSTTGGSSVVTSVQGGTVVVTVSASATNGSNNNNNNNNGGGGGTSVAGVAAGVVVGVLAVAAIVGGIFFWLRHRRRQQAEEDYKRSAQVSDFMRGTSERKAPNTGYSQMSDSRLDPEAGRRNSVGSMADEHDYSRRILRVANPDH